VDDHGIVRDGITALLRLQPNMEIVGTAGSGPDAVTAALQTRPDVITMDMLLPGITGIDATLQILGALPATRIVMLSVCHTSEHVFLALRAGACGYVLKEDAGVELVRAVATAAVGGQYLSQGLNRRHLDRILGDPQDRSTLDCLSSREREVLQLTVSGSTSAATARLLHLSPKTVDSYRNRLLSKLGVASVSELVHSAISDSLSPR
jgi:DNA-binding NarL/FixJ family response regulator